MARTQTGFGPTEGRVGPHTYYMRDGQLIIRIKDNLVGKRHPSTAQARQQSMMRNLVSAWRSTDRGLKGCFENKKPGATDYSGFLAANLPEARVYLPKSPRGESPCVLDNFFVAMGTLQPPISVEMSEEWAVSDISAGAPGLSPDTEMGALSRDLAGSNNGAFQMGDELLFVRLRQGVDLNSKMPQVSGYVNRFRLEYSNIRTLSQQFPSEESRDGFQVVEGRLAARRREGEMVAWIRLRHEADGTTRATTQRLVGHNPLITRYLSAEAIQEAVASYKPSKARFLVPEAVQAPRVSIMVSSNDVRLGVVEGGGEYAAGAAVTLRAVPAEGARFVIWDDGEQSPVRSLAATGNGAFKAIFVPNV